jgi:hypothetical protein
MHYLIILGLIYLIAGPGYSTMQQTLLQLTSRGNGTPTGTHQSQTTP